MIELRQVQRNHAIADAGDDELPRRRAGLDVLAKHAGLLSVGDDLGEESLDLRVVLAHHAQHLLVATGRQRAVQNVVCVGELLHVLRQLGADAADLLRGIVDAFDQIMPMLHRPVADGLDDGDEQLLLAFEMAVKDRFGNARRQRDGGGSRGLVAVAREQLGRHFHQLLPPLRGFKPGHA